MTVEETSVDLGDTVRLRSGPYADQTGTVVRVHTYGNHNAAGALVLVQLSNGRINSCYVNNLEKVEESPSDDG